MTDHPLPPLPDPSWPFANKYGDKDMREYAQAAVDAAVKAEREACLAEIEQGIWFDKTVEQILDSIAAAIRNRAQAQGEKG